MRSPYYERASYRDLHEVTPLRELTQFQEHEGRILQRQ